MHFRIRQIRLKPGEDKSLIPQKIEKKTGELNEDSNASLEKAEQ